MYVFIINHTYLYTDMKYIKKEVPAVQSTLQKITDIKITKRNKNNTLLS